MVNILLEATESGNFLQMIFGNPLILILLMFGVMYFIIIRPQQKQRKEIQKFQNELAEGTPVVTGGGIYGTVKSVDLTKNTVDVKIARDVVITVDKGSVYKDMANVGQK